MKASFTILLILSNIFCFSQEDKTRDCLEQWNLRNIGIREQDYNRGKFIEYVQKLCDSPVGSSYCSCYVNMGLLDCGVSKKNLPFAAAWSPSWFIDEKIIYIQNKHGKVEDWQKGDIFGLYYEELSRIGHVGYIAYIYPNKGYVLTFEGNTADTGNKWNPGEGIHSKKRSLKQINMVANWVSTNTNTQVDVIYYYVQKKDTLYRIADKYNVSIDDIKSWNPDVTDNIIFLGQKLTIYK